MTLQDLGALGEMVSAIAIVVSLVYVGIQIRQSTTASRSATAQAFSMQYSDANKMLMHSDVRGIFARGLNGIGELGLEERVGFMAVLSSISRTVESFYFQKMSGGLEEELYGGWLVQFLDLLSTRGGGEFWAIRKHQYTSTFVAYLDDKLSRHSARPLYERSAT